jgi:NitT/TauT family transport system permease protein
VFFPIFINVMKGLTQIDATQAELMRSYAASPRDVLRHVRIPNALPFFFTGFKTAASGAVISAVVAEYFGGPQKGLGYYISSNAAQTRTPQAWAYVVAACLLGLTFFLISLVLERLAMPWRARRDAAAT